MKRFSSFIAKSRRGGKADEAVQKPSWNPFNDPPPEYSPTRTPSVPRTYSDVIRSAVAANNANSADNSFLALFDTLFLIDDSSSMSSKEFRHASGGMTRWQRAMKVLNDFVAESIKYDEDGIDLYFLNMRNPHDRIGKPEAGFPGGGFREIRSAEIVDNIFESIIPNGATPTARRLEYILDSYIGRYSELFKTTKNESCLRPLNIIVITDGHPYTGLSNPQEEQQLVKDVLIKAAQTLDKLNAPSYQVGVQFFQIGEDKSASDFLEYLDNTLAEEARRKCGGGSLELRDMVDTTHFQPGKELTQEAITKALLGAIDKLVDRRPTKVQ
ncbi:hypothetical protein F5Y16DRAFT_362432 [Xylariaceae sp. FL0255]|nr:hypothetical protein F5Y16DRAFT_362432 [Xylariaceae sp. FL0255]